MAELGDSLERMTFMQLLLLFGFITSYVLAIGGLLGPRSRRRAALVAALLAVAFSALTDPWVHGALLMIFVIAGLGLFVMLTWLLARLLAPREAPAEEAAPAEAAAEPAMSSPTPSFLPSQPEGPSLPPRQGDNMAPVAKLARRG